MANTRFLFLFLILQSFFGLAQSTETVKVGKIFNFSYPKTYFKTFDLNSDASLQITNNVYGKHTIIIQDDRKTLKNLERWPNPLKKSINILI